MGNHEQAAFSVAEERLLLERVASSPTFQRSARLRDLLLDIGEHSLAGQFDELSEHAIGVRVFGRPEAYNSSEDNIVRASVRQIRQKLREYFETEGLPESLLIDIPKGGYVAVFRRRPPELTINRLIEPAPPSSRPRSPKVWPLLCALLLAACLFLGYRTRQAAPPEAHNLLTAVMGQSEGSVRYVFADAMVVVLNLFSGTNASLDAYANHSAFDDIAQRSHSEETRQFLEKLKTRQITSLADVLILFKLFQTAPAAARRIEVRHAKYMNARDFKYGNFILVGSQTSNPWAALFEPYLNFQMIAGTDAIRNVAAAATEPGEYLTRPNDHIDMARIALLKNLSGNGFVLLVAGKNMEGTEGAGEFLLREDSLPLVRNTLRLKDSESIPSFELVLEIGMLEGTARSARIVAWRRH